VSAICAAEPPPPPPPETATLSVCKERAQNSLFFEPNDFAFTVTSNGLELDEFLGDNSDGCVDVTIGPGEYSVIERQVSGGGAFIFQQTRLERECMQDPTNVLRASGEIQAGETQVCTFINTISD
jgi:hypothetical protein